MFWQFMNKKGCPRLLMLHGTAPLKSLTTCSTISNETGLQSSRPFGLIKLILCSSTRREERKLLRFAKSANVSLVAVENT
jgi:hypothetical protein